MITLKVRTASWSIRSSRETRKVTTVLLVLSFSYNLSSVFFFLRSFPWINPPILKLRFVFRARGAMLVASAVSTGLSCTLRESERFRASKPVKDPWETSSGAPETGLEHCAWSPSARGCWAREAPTRKEASRGPWVGGWWHGRGGVWGWRARWGCEGGCVASGHGARVGEGWSTPRVLTAWEGRVCVA